VGDVRQPHGGGVEPELGEGVGRGV
jgi:hypothetical protein